jgi:hypothetical protein
MQARDIFGLEGLADLGSRNGVDMRPTLLRVLTDLYVHRLSHSPAEERHYTELALRLLEAVDVPTRIAVARRFARYLSPPLPVLQWLSRDLPEVAAELRTHPLLQAPAPTMAAKAAPAAPIPVTEDKTMRHERQATGPVRSLDRATAEELNVRFFAANAEERRLILLNFNVVAPVEAGRSKVAREPAVGQRLEAAALTGNRDNFALQLARALHIPHDQARRIVRDDLGESVVVAAKVLGMPRDVLYRVLMFLNPAVGHSVERVHALAALYEEIPVAAAEALLAIWQTLQQSERPAAKHQPLAWDDETRRRARPGAPMQRAPAAPPPGQRRNAS